MKIKFNKKLAKWYCKYGYECFECPSTGLPTEDYDTVMMTSLSVLMGENIYGELGPQGASPGTYRVKFETPYGKYWAWYDFDMKVTV